MRMCDFTWWRLCECTTGNIVFIGLDIATNQWAQLPERYYPLFHFLGVIIVPLAKQHFKLIGLNVWQLWLLGFKLLL